MAQFYRALNGINFPSGKKVKEGEPVDEIRLEIGDVHDQIPDDAVVWLLEGGHIERAAPPVVVAPAKSGKGA